MTALATLLVAAGLSVGPMGAAEAAAGCGDPTAAFVFNDSTGITYLKGRGTDRCNNVNAVGIKVQVFYRQGSAHPYRVRTDTGWISKGNIGAARTFSREGNYTSANCGQWYVRTWVRFKYKGHSAYTTRDTIKQMPRPACG